MTKAIAGLRNELRYRIGLGQLEATVAMRTSVTTMVVGGMLETGIRNTLRRSSVETKLFVANSVARWWSLLLVRVAIQVGHGHRLVGRSSIHTFEPPGRVLGT